MQAQPDPSDSLVFECDFDEPPEKVWRALTEPRLLEAWLTTDEPGRADPRQESPASPRRLAAATLPDGRVSVEARGGRTGSSCYEILTAEPHRLLRYGWQDREGREGDSGGREVHSVVTVELAPGQSGGTHLRLTHGEFRIVPAAATAAVAPIRVTPITSAQRRRRPIVSLAAPYPLRRVA
ncbi:MAG TPA: SRPBCC domain-containing protein [Steroidobacteraceae bacterium]|nr:SRPBCC domain-containing protein [Steroidobacteraceae bacterium]